MLLCSELVLPLSLELNFTAKVEFVQEDLNEPSSSEVEIIPPVLGKREKPEEEKKQEEMPLQRVAVAMTELELKLYEL